MKIDPALYDKYPKERIDEAIKLLNYHEADPLPKEESDEFPVMYIFRHGQSEDNANFIFSGWRTSPITEEGKKQALVLAPVFKDKKIDMLISSPQKRALETLELAMSQNEIAKTREVHTDPRVKERSYGDFQGHSKLEIQLEDPKRLAKIRRSFTEIPPNGESIEAVCKRVAEFCDEIIPLMKQHHLNVAVSCHGNSIRGFRRYFENLSDEETAHVETKLGQDYAAYVIK